MDDTRKCLIRLTNNALIVANTGQPFNRLGVISICASHIGTKKRSQPIDSFLKCRDIDLPEAIREREIETYLRDENRLIADYNLENEVSADYGGRFLWELLQNADDAMSPLQTPSVDLIGLKGIGFKSVLEISKKPTIYSNPFHFYFSADDSIGLLKKRGIKNPPSITFRIPHDGSNIEDIIDLVDEYPTIISLPFLDTETYDKVESEMRKLDVFFLLLCQYIRCVEVEFPDGQNRQWRIAKDNDGEIKDGDIYVEAFKNGQLEETHRFRRWANIWSSKRGGKRNSVAICLPLNEDHIVKLWERTFPLFTFFPTEETLPFRCLFHASFGLDQSRKHVRKPISNDILDQLEVLLDRILDELPAEISLESFTPKEPPNQDTLAGILWERCRAVLENKKFVPCIGGRSVAPPDAKIWENDLGDVLRKDGKALDSIFLVEPRLLKNEDIRKALYDLGAIDLDKIKYLNILRHCMNDDLRSCRNALVVLFKTLKDIKTFPYREQDYYLNICHGIPCWMTDRGIARSLNESTPVLRKEPGIDIPEWLSFDVLDNELLGHVKQLESKDSNDSVKIWKRVLSDILLDNKSDQLLNHLLVPTIEKKKESDWWEIHGGEVLEIYESWTSDLKFKGKPAAIWNDLDRERIGHSLFLPTDKGWMPSWMCYAGKDWGAFEYFDVFFKEINERGVIEGPDKWPVNIDEKREHWENILCYAGVSWGMKLVSQKPSGLDDWKIARNAESWSIECPFGNMINKSDWDKYLTSLKPPSFNRRTQLDWDSKAHEQWGIEFFPDALPKKPADMVRAIMPIAVEAKNSKMRYSFQKGGGVNGRNKGQIKSLAAWQIDDSPWVPCKQSLLDGRQSVQPDRAYMPGKSIGGLLPEIMIRVADSQDGRDMATFLTQVLMVREVLPPSGDLLWKEWICKLPESAMEAENQDAAIKVTRMLYGHFLKIHDEKPEWFEERYEIPSLMMAQNEKNELLSFGRASEVYWLDEPYLAVPSTRNELLRRFKIFILEQEQGKKAKGWFQIEPLSNIVQVEPRYHLENYELTNSISKRYRERFDHLKVASDQSNIPEPGDLKILAVEDLRLRIIKEGELISAPNVSSWKKNGLLLIEGSRKWEALGLALAKGQSQKDHSNLFENLLRANTISEVYQRLRELGVPESAFDDLNSDFNESLINNKPISPEPQNPESETTPDSSDKPERQKETAYKKSISGQQTDAPDHLNNSGIVDGPKKGKKQVSSGAASQSRREKGKNAEDWMRSQISELMSITDWTVSGRPEKDQYGRESDIVLSHPEFGKYHIEVKHVESGYIFWSELEVAKAKDNDGRYCIVVVQPDYMINDQKVVWLWNPLDNFLNLQRRGKWLWRTETDEPSDLDSGWDIPSPRKVTEATNFSFVISLDDRFLKNPKFDLARGLNPIKEKLGRLATGMRGSSYPGG